MCVSLQYMSCDFHVRSLAIDASAWTAPWRELALLYETF